MGNHTSRESARDGEGSSSGAQRTSRPSLGPAFEPQTSAFGPSSNTRRARASRTDLGGILGIGPVTGSSGGGSHSGSGSGSAHERRETKQEREAKKLEKERIARLKERERSLREEHVDGGYLVTLGTYIGPEDFSKPVVRQLQIERRLAPFWRGLNDVNDQWAEHQIIAAARGLPIPAADQTPPDDLVPRRVNFDSPSTSHSNLNLTVPIGPRTLSTNSDQGAIPSPSSPTAPGRSSPFKSRPKALASALHLGSRNNSSADLTPREINLPPDPFVSGSQPLEVFLYKSPSECPICFLYYPPYLNHTRCCGQPICSECFVQIKRPDPHYPEGHGDADTAERNPEEAAGLLISEPACCPYCQQPDFGVTYEAPPFRRGLAYAFNPATAMSSNTSLSSTLSPGMGSPTSAPTSTSGAGGLATGNRRRTESVSANAPNVILTDRVRPDWSSKLAAARAHLARRAAAATALHTAAFLMSTGSAETRNYRQARFSRRGTGSGSGLIAPTSATGLGSGAGTSIEVSQSVAGQDGDSVVPAMPPGFLTGIEGVRTSSARAGPGGMILPVGGPGSGPDGGRTRMDDLEDMMLMEAIRLSLAAEEERKRKMEKEERKEAKKREKEERKAAKAAAKNGGGPYDGHGSASGSTLSLPGLGAIGRRRGNSGASSLRVEASLANAMASGSAPVTPGGSSASATNDKGKGVERPLSLVHEGDGEENGLSTSKGVDRSPSPPSGSSTPPYPSSTSATSAPRPIPTASAASPGPSHLRQMSSASSVSSSLGPDSAAGSYNASHSHGHGYLHGDPRGSALSLSARSEGEGGEQEHDPSASTEPMFNFRSLAEMVGVQIEGENAGRRTSVIEKEKAEKERDGEREKPAAERQDSGSTTASDAHDDGKHDDGEVGIFASHLENDEVPDSQSTAVETEQSVATLTPVRAQLQGKKSFDRSFKLGSGAGAGGGLAPPTLMVTPETPAPMDEVESEGKQLGFSSEAAHGEITQ